MKRTLSLLLALLLCVGMLPSGVLAAGEISGEDSTVTEASAEPETGSAEEPAEGSPEEDPVPDGSDESFTGTAAGPTGSCTTEPLYDSDTLLAGYLNNALGDDLFELPDGPVADGGTAAGDRLTGESRHLYDQLKAAVQKIAAGEVTSSVITLTVDAVDTDTWYTAADLGVSGNAVEALISNDKAVVNEDALEALYKKFYSDIDLHLIIKALVYDCPYDMYWYGNYCEWEGPGYYWRCSSDEMSGSELRLAGNTITMYLTIDTPYDAGGYTVSLGASASAIDTAVSTAKAWAAAAAGKSDYEKLVYYREQICNAVSYNTAAARTGSGKYGDLNPWNIIWVFDGDSSTNVVCEGYAKAFQYLCDLTDWYDDSIYCLYVSGTLGSEGHGWNVVHMPNGKNYLVDVTNCDSGTAGYPDRLFMVGGSGSAADGYTFLKKQYMYDLSGENMLALYAADMLTLADADYDPLDGPIAGTCGSGLTWTLNAGTLTVSGTGSMYDYDNLGSPWYYYRSGITSAVIGDGVTYIGACAFEHCSALTEVTIPAGAAGIGEYAFNACTSLTDVYYGGSETEKESIAIDDTEDSNAALFAAEWHYSYTVTYDANGGSGAPGAQSAYIGTELTIGSGRPTRTGYIFLGWSEDSGAVTADHTAGSVFIADTDTVLYAVWEEASGKCGDLTWSLDSVSGTLTVSGKGEIPDFAAPGENTAPWHDGIPYIRSVVIGSGVTAIGSCAFYGCTELVSVNISDSMERIGSDVFSGCTDLKDIYYCGTEEQWANLDSDIDGCTIHCGAHLWDDGVITAEPTCVRTGAKMYTCMICGDTKAADVPAAGHTPVTGAAVPATCTGTGLSEGSRCSVCGATITAQKVVAAKGHTWDAGVVTEAPTTVRTGIKTYTCTVCGETKTETLDKLTVTHDGTGWEQDPYTENWYYFKDSVMVTGSWLQSGSYWYYLGRDGVMVTGLQQIEYKEKLNTYYFDEHGRMQTGWQKLGDSWYYFGNAMYKDQWLKYNGSWYYFDADGIMVTGKAATVDGIYYFASSGKMQSGWQQIGSSWYYFGNAMYAGRWLQSNGYWYYFNADGVMVTGLQKIKSGDELKTYYFNTRGRMQSGWQQIGSSWYYFGSAMYADQWLKYNSYWYYFNADGVMVTGTGIRCVNSSGVWSTNNFDDSGRWLGKA